MPDFIDPWVTVGSIRKAYFYYQIISSKIPAEAEFYSISPIVMLSSSSLLCHVELNHDSSSWELNACPKYRILLPRNHVVSDKLKSKKLK